MSGKGAMLPYIILAVAAFVAGVQNALAGGGSFLTFPALLFSGIGPLAANVTSTIALFPGQVASGLANRSDITGIPGLRFQTLFVISLVGGALGAWLLLSTPEQVFSALVPYLVLFATVVFAWGSFFRKPNRTGQHMGAKWAALCQLGIAIYGGYFGGGIGILMLAALTMAGLAVRKAGATKNALAGVMNASAVAIFAFSKDVAWKQVVIVGVAALIGGQLGAYAFRHVNERLLRICITVLGLALTVGLFIRAAHGS